MGKVRLLEHMHTAQCLLFICLMFNCNTAKWTCNEFHLSRCVYDAFVCFMPFCRIFVSAAVLVSEMNFPAGRYKAAPRLSNLLQYEA